MILFFLLMLLGFGFVFRNKVILWMTTKRMAYRHYMTSMKIEVLKMLHDIGLL